MKILSPCKNITSHHSIDFNGQVWVIKFIVKVIGLIVQLLRWAVLYQVKQEEMWLICRA